jgi:hypothetical protein
MNNNNSTYHIMALRSAKDAKSIGLSPYVWFKEKFVQQVLCQYLSEKEMIAIQNLVWYELYDNTRII